MTRALKATGFKPLPLIEYQILVSKCAFQIQLAPLHYGLFMYNKNATAVGLALFT